MESSTLVVRDRRTCALVDLLRWSTKGPACKGDPADKALQQLVQYLDMLVLDCKHRNKASPCSRTAQPQRPLPWQAQRPLSLWASAAGLEQCIFLDPEVGGIVTNAAPLKCNTGACCCGHRSPCMRNSPVLRTSTRLTLINKSPRTEGKDTSGKDAITSTRRKRVVTEHERDV